MSVHGHDVIVWSVTGLCFENKEIPRIKKSIWTLLGKKKNQNLKKNNHNRTKHEIIRRIPLCDILDPLPEISVVYVSFTYFDE